MNTKIDSAIVKTLKGNYGARLSCGWRWMVWDNTKWVVYERKPYSKNTQIIISTEDEKYAVAVLTVE
jgi:hypothetical protein